MENNPEVVHEVRPWATCDALCNQTGCLTLTILVTIANLIHFGEV